MVRNLIVGNRSASHSDMVDSAIPWGCDIAKMLAYER